VTDVEPTVPKLVAFSRMNVVLFEVPDLSRDEILRVLDNNALVAKALT